MNTSPRACLSRALLFVLVAAGAAALASCSQKTCTGFEAPARNDGPLQRVADFGPYQVTGVAVSRAGRIFVNFPQWGGSHQHSVAEVLPDGTLAPYPDQAWNTMSAPGGSLMPQEAAVPYESELADDRAAAGQAVASGHSSPTNAPLYFVCVQSVYVDANDRLWVLDSASPNFAGVLAEGGGAKLVQIDLASNRAVRVYTFDADAAPYNSYLNDVRIDTATQTAFITDSNLGAIVVLDLVTAKARRLLADDPSTKANPNRAPMINGRDWRASDGGNVPQIHSDGIALDPKTGTLYWQSLTNDRLYAIDSRLLTSRTAPGWQINNSVRCLGTTCVADGMLCDPTGDVYFTALEMNAVVRLHASDARQAFKEGRTVDLTRSLRTIVQDPRLGWPDSLAIGPAGPTGPIAATDGADTPARPGGTWLYITTSQIDRMSRFNSNPATPTPTTPTTSTTSTTSTTGTTGTTGDQPAEGPGYALWRVKLP